MRFSWSYTLHVRNPSKRSRGGEHVDGLLLVHAEVEETLRVGELEPTPV